MALTIRKNAPSLVTTLFDSVFEFEFPQAVRLLGKLNAHRSSPGDTNVLFNESVRFSGKIGFSVSSSDLFSLKPGTPPTLTVAFLGIAGIQGPLPDVFTEILIDRLKVKDNALLSSQSRAVGGIDFNSDLGHNMSNI